MTNLVHIADRVLNRPLMILPEKLALISQILEGRISIDASGLAPDGEKLADLSKAAPDASRFVGQYQLTDPNDPRSHKPYRQTDKGVAVITVLGSLVNRGAWIGAYSGMTSYEGLKHQIAAAAADKSVPSIVLDIDSPGGEAVGAFEVADVVREASKSKDVVAVVNGMAASAAYAIASAAKRIVTTPSGIAGSIGVVMLHADYSHRVHEAGIVPTLIFAGARKVDGNPYEKLTDEVKAELKSEIDRFYDLFVQSVATGRKAMTADAIRATEARTYIGADAVKVGLADEVGSFEAALSVLSDQVSLFRKMRGSTMDDKDNTVTRAQHDAAVAVARAEGAASAKADLNEAAKAEAKKAGATAERDRIKAITSLEEAKGREAAALKFALTTDLTAEQCKEVLAELPKADPAQANRSGNNPGGLVINNDKPDASKTAKSSWDEVTAEVNKSVRAS